MFYLKWIASFDVLRPAQLLVFFVIVLQLICVTSTEFHFIYPFILQHNQ